MRENELSRAVIGAAMEVQSGLGLGLLESAYATALALELSDRRIAFAREVGIPGMYKGRPLGLAYRADLLVDDTLIVEVKAVEGLTRLHQAQLLSYLRLSGLKLGLLINFHAAPLSRGIVRVVNNL